MPKRVDHHSRRIEIADALVRVAATRGLEAVSLRHVAAEAGVTSGMVQHYFRTKDEMMAFALKAVSDNAEARITAATRRLGPVPSPRDLLRTMLVELLPVDEPRRADGRVALAFLAYTAAHPAVAATLREQNARMHAFVAGQLRAARSAHQAPAALDPDHAATTLLALVEGLGLYLLGDNYPPATAVAALDAYLALLFDPAPG